MQENRPAPVLVRSQSPLFKLITQEEIEDKEKDNEVKKLTKPDRTIQGATKN